MTVLTDAQLAILDTLTTDGLEVTMTAEDYAAGQPTCRDCPWAIAIRRAAAQLLVRLGFVSPGGPYVPITSYVSDWTACITVGTREDGSRSIYFPLPGEVAAWIRNYDKGTLTQPGPMRRTVRFAVERPAS